MSVTQPAGAVLTLATGAINDQVFSPDGKTLYTARDGTITSYDVGTGTQLNSWTIGSDLGAIDLSADGKTLVAVELTPAATGSLSDQAHYSVYDLDLQSGQATTIDLSRSDPEPFSDVAFLPDGTVMLCGGQWNPLTVLDLTTHKTTALSDSFYNPTLTTSPDHKHILISEDGISDASFSIYTVGKGVVGEHGGYADGIEGSNSGVQAISPDGSRTVEGIELAVYDGAAHLLTKLGDRYPFRASGLEFSPDGTKLYLLDGPSNHVYVLDAKSWDVLGGYPVGASVADPYSGYAESAPATHAGDALLVSSDGTHLAISTSVSTQIIDLTTAVSDTATSAGNDTVSGDSDNNVLYGFDGNDTLDGKGGSDTMYGGAGNDTYYVDNAGDQVVENASGGQDIIYSSYSGYQLAAQVETLALIGTATVAYGNDSANTLIANDLGDTLDGYGGDDVLTGGKGADTLDGGLGNDHMAGGKGNDSYIVDAPGDVITEKAGEGTDTITASFSYTLPDNVENLTLAVGTQTLTETGNALDNLLIGNDGDNRIDGGSGADTMQGGRGDDTYVVDNGHDKVSEAAGAGTDTIEASVGWRLEDNVENLTLTGAATVGKGNALANVMTANDLGDTFYAFDGNDTLVGGKGADHLDGGSGADTMQGGAGNDTYVVDNAHDVVTESANAGTDTIETSVSWRLESNVENLTLTGTADLVGKGNGLDNHLVGNTGADSLYGLDGDDVIQGGLGRDLLSGGSGHNSFVFTSVADFASASGSKADEIIDWGTGDRIDLSAIDAKAGGKDDAFTWIGQASFDHHAGELQLFIKAGTTYVFGDVDGDGKADFGLKLDGVHNLTAADFVL